MLNAKLLSLVVLLAATAVLPGCGKDKKCDGKKTERQDHRSKKMNKKASKKSTKKTSKKETSKDFEFRK